MPRQHVESNKTQHSGSDSVVLGRFVLAASKTSRLELHQFVTPSLHWSCLSYRLSYLSYLSACDTTMAARIPGPFLQQLLSKKENGAACASWNCENFVLFL